MKWRCAAAGSPTSEGRHSCRLAAVAQGVAATNAAQRWLTLLQHISDCRKRGAGQMLHARKDSPSASLPSCL
eukprot:365212-Chlamydomonas_euryale.AAC.5